LSSGRTGSNSYKHQKNDKPIVKIMKNIVKIIQATVAKSAATGLDCKSGVKKGVLFTPGN
jgi:hypothetical protein